MAPPPSATGRSKKANTTSAVASSKSPAVPNARSRERAPGGSAKFFRPMARAIQTNKNAQMRKGRAMLDSTKGFRPSSSHTMPPPDENLKASLLEAQRKNRALQLHVVQKLQQIATQKAENRQVSNKLMERLSYVWRHHTHHETTPPAQAGGTTGNTQTDTINNESGINQQHQGQLQTQNDSEERQSAGVTGASGSETDQGSSRGVNVVDDTTSTAASASATSETGQDALDHMSPHLRSKHLEQYEYSTVRRWNRGFFVDPSGSIPEPNADTLKRRQLDTNSAQSNFFFHKSPPWSNKQTKALQQVVRQKLVSTENASESESRQKDLAEEGGDTDGRSRSDPTSTFWEDVASQLEEKIPTDQKATMIVPRSADECRIHYEQHQNVHKFTKNESMKILEHVHRASPNPPDWQVVATSLQNGSSADFQTGRKPTAWKCLVHYHTHLRPSKVSTWSLQQDSTVFAYLAAMGPQFVWDMESANHVAGRLFAATTTGQGVGLPKNNKHLLVRANQSLLNPHFLSDFWTTDDERRLVLCMKIYSTMNDEEADKRLNHGDPNDGKGSPAKQKPQALNYIARVHFPHRGAAGVVAKWNKRMDPALSWKAFTKKDVEAILQAVREFARSKAPNAEPERGRSSNSSLIPDQQTLLQFLEDKFPSWDSHRVYRQWMRNASDDEMLKAVGDRTLLDKVVKQKRFYRTSSSKKASVTTASNQGSQQRKLAGRKRTQTGEATQQDGNGSAQSFNPSDFVLEVVQNSNESKTGTRTPKKRRKGEHTNT